MKYCTTCKLSKPLEAFYNNRNYKDGKTYDCKKCRKQAANNYYQENKYQQNEVRKIRRLLDPEWKEKQQNYHRLWREKQVA